MSIINNTQATIDTVVPTLNIGQIQISADRRSTKLAPLADADRIRRVVLPANHWGDYSALLEGARSQSLTDILREALRGIAAERLRDSLAADPMLRTVALADYSVSSLLAWSNETATSRGSITFTRDQATEWFNVSATAKALAAKHGPVKAGTILAFLSNRFGALAAKNHGLKDVAEASKLAAIIDPADLEGEHAALVAEIIGRLENIVKTLTAKANEATVSMDDI